MTLFYLMPIVFILGIIGIALEDVIKVNKAATAVGMSIVLWLFFLLDAVGIFEAHQPAYIANFVAGFPDFAAMDVVDKAYRFIEFAITEALGDVSTTLFFVLASMLIIEILDSHGSFAVITNMIKAREKRSLLWIFSFITFFLSAVLGNLATIIVMIAVMGKIIPDRNIRLPYACMAILAANAGGSWSPIGDVTTLLLWTGGNISVLHQITHVFLPALTMMMVPLLILSLSFKKGEKIQEAEITHVEMPEYVTPKFQKLLLWIGILSLIMVPVLQSLIDLPPFMGVLLGLVILWFITDIKSAASSSHKSKELKVSALFSKIDITTVMFFLGILMSVQALNASGILTIMADGLNSVVSDSNVIAILLGVCSSFLDNVALVAASMGMYDIAASGPFMVDGSFWTFLAYCAVTGGSILIIGSATGVTAMGLEKISFGYYLKKFSILALLGYAAGAAVFLLMSNIF